MEDDDLDLTDNPEAMDRALAVHEAGHAIVAWALGADVVFVEIDIATGNGASRSSNFDDGQIKNLAVCVAGFRAEHLLDASTLKQTKKGDFRLMRELLSSLPKAERRAARVQGYQLADETLNAKADVVRRIADELLARRWIGDDTIVRIEGDELIALFHG